MNKLLHFTGVILTVLWDVVEFLALPALLVVIGLLNSFPWQYYAIAIGGYFALFIVLEIAVCFVGKALNKHYSPLIRRKLDKIFERFSKKG